MPDVEHWHRYIADKFHGTGSCLKRKSTIPVDQLVQIVRPVNEKLKFSNDLSENRDESATWFDYTFTQVYLGTALRKLANSNSL